METSLSSRKIYNAVGKEQCTEAQSKAWEGRGDGIKKHGELEDQRRAGVAAERPIE